MTAFESAGESVEDLAAELDSLVRLIEDHPEKEVQSLGLRLLDRVDALHRLGLTELVEALREGNASGPMQLAIDRAPARFLLQLYDLLPGDDPGPLEIALEQLRPTLAANGAEISLVGVTDGIPRLSLVAQDPEAIQGLREMVATELREQFLALQTVRFEDQRRAQPDELLSLIVVDRAPTQVWTWFPVRRLDNMPPGAIVTDTVAGRKLAIWLSGDDVVGARDICPGSPLPLAACSVSGGELRCPWHGCRFDSRTGRRLGGVGESVELFTLAVREGMIEIELPAEPARQGVAVQ